MPIDPLHTIPIASVFSRPEESTPDYLDIARRLPSKIMAILKSDHTASYIKGLARSYDVTEDFTPNISFAVLEIAIGKKNFSQLPAVLSTELKLPNDKAQNMASEIEKDVFGTVRNELDTFLREQKTKTGSITSKLSPSTIKSRPIQNVLNLKELPPKPVSKILPPDHTADHPKFPLPPKIPQPPTQPIRFT